MKRTDKPLSPVQRAVLTLLRKYKANNEVSARLCTRTTEIAHGNVSGLTAKHLARRGLVVVVAQRGGEVAYLTEAGFAAEEALHAPKPLKGVKGKRTLEEKHTPWK